MAAAAAAIGSANLVVAIDARRSQAAGWEVCTHGGRRPTGIDAVGWARRMAEAGAGEILVIKAGEIHEFKCIGDEPLEQVDVHLSPRFIQENLPG